MDALFYGCFWPKAATQILLIDQIGNVRFAQKQPLSSIRLD
jgi:hypothetical protein